MLDKPGTGSAMYTRNMCCSEAVIFDKNNTAHGKIQLLCVISKNANVFTPTSGEDIHKIAEALATECQVPKESILLSCTGVIGVPLPVRKILEGIKGISKKLKKNHLLESAKAILTTDPKYKVVSVRLNDIVICGFAKGAGMLEPNMATMLVYLFTNARIEKIVLDQLLKEAVDCSFHCITVDTDTSTSDTVALMSTNEVELPDGEIADFRLAMKAVCIKLARDIVGQSEGATKVIEITVSTETSEREAKVFAKKIANSPLVKTAVNGADPNWGRIVMAIGKPSDEHNFDQIKPESVLIKFMNEIVFDRCQPITLDLNELSRKIKESKTISIEVCIGQPIYSAKVWGCDLSDEYVVINSQYTT
jgi:glutamate N-acetyltransferase/amino-acid N-acetyltransferase